MTRLYSSPRPILFAVLLFMAGMSFPVCAQTRVSLALERTEFLLYEPIEAGVRIDNQSAEPLDMEHLSKGEPWLDFFIVTPENEQIGRVEKVWKPPALSVPPGETSSVTVNLLPWFLIRDSGEYRVTAVVSIGGNRIVSRPVAFTVVNGVMIWERRFIAPPASDDASQTPRPRHYSLLIQRRDDRQVLYVRIQNPEAGRVYCTTPVGSIVNFGEPRTRIDLRGDLHVFHQSGARLFNFTKFSPTGKLLGARYFSNISSTPTMVAVENKETEIVGGEERFADDDKQQDEIAAAPVVRTPPNWEQKGKKKEEKKRQIILTPEF